MIQGNSNQIGVGQLIELIRELSTQHKMIRSFGFGRLSDVEANERTYPLCFMSVPIGQLTDNGADYIFKSFTFDLIVADRLDTSLKNYQEILNETDYVLDTMVNTLKRHRKYKTLGLIFEGDATLNPVIEGGTDDVNGYSVTITVKQINRLTPCNSPIEPILGWTYSFTGNGTNTYYITYLGEQGPPGVTGATGAGAEIEVVNGLTMSNDVIYLGGDLIQDTNIGGQDNWGLNLGIPSNQLLSFGINSLNSNIIKVDTGSGIASLTQDTNGVNIQHLNNLNEFTFFNINAQGALIASNYAGFQGILEYGDYSPNYIASSLVRKSYVDQLVASASVNAQNGLTFSSGILQLGGELIQDTQIGGLNGASSLQLGYVGFSSSPLLNFDVYSTGTLTLNNNPGLNSGILQINNTALTLQFSNGFNNAQFDVGPGYIQVLSTDLGFAGIQEGNDFSPNYTAGSLVRKSYVDGLVATSSYTPTQSYVPYLGATNSVNLGTFSLTASGIGIGINPGINELININVNQNSEGRIFVNNQSSGAGAGAAIKLGNNNNSALIVQASTGNSNYIPNALNFHQATTGGFVFSTSTFSSMLKLNTNGSTQSVPMEVRIGAGKFIIDSIPTFGTGFNPALFNLAPGTAPSSTNFMLWADSQNSYFNGPSTAARISVANGVKAIYGVSTTVFSTSVANTGTQIPYTFTAPANINQTLGADIPNLMITGATKQWATGALPLQMFARFATNSIAFVGVSTATDAYNVYIDSVSQGTNATITNAYALGLGGRLGILSTTEQQRISYDASNYYTHRVFSDGSVIISGAGSGAGLMDLNLGKNGTVQWRVTNGSAGGNANANLTLSSNVTNGSLTKYGDSYTTNGLQAAQRLMLSNDRDMVINVGTTYSLIFGQANLIENWRISGSASSLSNNGSQGTAYIDLKGGLTSSAQLRLRSGATVSVPNEGDIFNAGLHLQYRNNGVTTQLDSVHGTSSVVGNSILTVFTITHNAGFTPVNVQVTPTNLLASGSYYVNNFTSTTFDINYTVAPGIGSLTMNWLVK